MQLTLRYLVGGLMLPSLLLSGCGWGGIPPQPFTGGGSTGLSISGDWGVIATSNDAGGQYVAGVQLSGSAGTFSGIVHVASPCNSISTNIPITGSVDNSGQFSLASPSGVGEVIRASGNVTSDGVITNGAYTVTNGCTGNDAGTMSGGIVAPLAGTYSGALTSSSGATIAASAQIQQTAAVDQNGLYHLSGTATFAGSQCFDSASIINPTTDTTVIGRYYGAGFTATDSVSTISTIGILSTDAKRLDISYEITNGPCAGDTGTGTLTQN